MKKAGKSKGIHCLIQRYKDLPRALHSRKLSEKNRAQKLLALTICIPLMIASLGYMISWEITRRNIEKDNAVFSSLYQPATQAPATALPTAFPSAAPITHSPTLPPKATSEPTEQPSAAPTETPFATPTPSPAAVTSQPSAEPSPTATISASPTPTASPAPAATPTAMVYEIAVDATIQPLATPDADTIVYAIETPPPTQYAFGDLLSLNPETVGFLRVGSALSLPVVQRPNDNEYYLNHSFNLEESIGGTLFLDGSNLLIPEDPNLIIYGHNMRNGTMFRPLINYESLSFLKENPLVRFDTIYENRTYVPFAVFTVTADPGSSRYVNLRQFMFDEESWNTYIDDLRTLSEHSIPVDVAYGDRVLLLVTCEYTHNNGRFVVALRAQREGESEDELKSRIQAAY